MDEKLLESLKTRSSVGSERLAILNEGHLQEVAIILSTDIEEDTRVLPALELLLLLSNDGNLRSRIAAHEGLVNNVKKFMSRGRLKQKKVAVMAFKNLQVRFKFLVTIVFCFPIKIVDNFYYTICVI
jgi:hypothetical protein